ncbi:hypothetical protein KY348_00705 [Candidatus Woesearchaeota archaeon]|nr:hypothetical protein [Candidatus Woesearchaeota archaeon]
MDNINYCIEQLKNNSHYEKPVVGYVLERGWGTKARHYRVLSQAKAEEQKKKNPRFDYITLDKLLRRKTDVKKGKYNVRKGLIISYNPARSH